MATVTARAMRALRAHARRPSEHPASGGFGSAFERLGLKTAEVRAVVRATAASLRGCDPRDAVRVAHALAATRTLEGRQVAYELLSRVKPAAAALTAADVERLGRGNDNWVSTDTFACLVAGPAWRAGVVRDARVRAWARARDRWWRRTALASCVALNVAARGGTGDVPRTLAIAGMLAADPEDMVAKAVSWALRTAVAHDARAVRAFLVRHEAELPARVRREVDHKLRTGTKHPRGARA